MKYIANYLTRPRKANGRLIKLWGNQVPMVLFACLMLLQRKTPKKNMSQPVYIYTSVGVVSLVIGRFLYKITQTSLQSDNISYRVDKENFRGWKLFSWMIFVLRYHISSLHS